MTTGDVFRFTPHYGLVSCVDAGFGAVGVRRPGTPRSDLLYVVLVNVMTNPVLVSVTTLILLTCGMRAYYISLSVFETAAFVAEALVYRRTLRAKINPFLLSALLNAVSFFLGNVINRVFF